MVNFIRQKRLDVSAVCEYNKEAISYTELFL